MILRDLEKTTSKPGKDAQKRQVKKRSTHRKGEKNDKEAVKRKGLTV